MEGGPSYIQWNIALYDDDVLCVVPGSHRRPATAEQDECLRSAGVGRHGRGGWVGQLPGAVRVRLAAGDGVAYINQIMHQVRLARQGRYCCSISQGPAVSSVHAANMECRPTEWP